MRKWCHGSEHRLELYTHLDKVWGLTVKALRTLRKIYILGYIESAVSSLESLDQKPYSSGLFSKMGNPKPKKLSELYAEVDALKSKKQVQDVLKQNGFDASPFPDSGLEDMGLRAVQTSPDGTAAADCTGAQRRRSCGPCTSSFPLWQRRSVATGQRTASCAKT